MISLKKEVPTGQTPLMLAPLDQWALAGGPNAVPPSTSHCVPAVERDIDAVMSRTERTIHVTADKLHKSQTSETLHNHEP